MAKRTWLLVGTLVLLFGGAALAAGKSTPPPKRNALLDMSLEQLMDTPVTSVSRKEAPLSRSAAAVAVISADDIRRLGVTSLPEALRLVPGLEVARINAHSWAITARGFNSQYSDKLLVMLDGRILYEARFPGVYWDAQDVVIEDIERIEVIRGPGATLWGANAVNGVINIITRTPADSAGALVSTSFGSEERPTTSVRYGGGIGRDLTYRVHGKLVNRDGFEDAAGRDVDDGWNAQRGGARLDWRHGHDRVTVQSDVYAVDGGELLTRPLLRPPFSQTTREAFRSEGASVLGQWRRQLSPTSDVSLQAYYAGSSYENTDQGASDDLADVELTHRFSPARHHDIVWGAGYRRRQDLLTSRTGSFLDPDHTRRLATAFIQDEIALVPDRVSVTVGTKLEHNSDSGASVDPSVRALWAATSSQIVWGAVSRAVRTPDLFELGARQPVAAFPTGPNGPVMLATLVGRPDLDAESVVAYELGYRTTPVRSLSIDVAAFSNDYSRLIGFVPGEPVFAFDPVTPHLMLPLEATNAARARTYGYEVSAHWNPSSSWRLSPSYTFLRTPPLTEFLEFDSPTHRAGLLSTVSLPKAVELNAAAYHVGALRAAGIPAYTRLDAGVTWSPTSTLELGLWGQNLTDDQHVEFFSVLATERVAVTRSVIAQVTWRPAGH